MRSLHLALLVSACLLLAAVPAWSGPFRMMGFDAASAGQGNGEVSWGHGPGVLYSNPALLVDIPEGFSVDVLSVTPFMDVELMDRPANADVPITFYDSDVGLAGSNLDRPLPTAELRVPRHDNKVSKSSSYIGVAITHTLGIEEYVRDKLDQDDFRFRLGLAAMVPIRSLASIEAQYPDEREQYFTNTVHFSRFGEWSQVLSVLFGVGARPVKWLSLGLSAEMGLNVGATLDMYIPEATVQDYALVNAAFDAKPTVRGIFGVAVQPLDWLSIGLVWRDRRYSEVDAHAQLNLWNYHEPGDETVPKRVVQRHLMALDFEPMEVSLGVGARYEGMFAQLSATWNHWADYIGTHHKRAQENAVWDPDADPDMRFEWADTFSLGLGLGYDYMDGATISLGGAWRPTPVPDQVGRTNYADADLYNVAFGHRYDWKVTDLRTLRIDVGFQFWFMGRTTVYKDPELIKDEFPDGARTLIGGQPMAEAAGLQTNNPGFPGYSFGGWALSLAASVAYLF